MVLIGLLMLYFCGALQTSYFDEQNVAIIVICLISLVSFVNVVLMVTFSLKKVVKALRKRRVRRRMKSQGAFEDTRGRKEPEAEGVEEVFEQGNGERARQAPTF